MLALDLVLSSVVCCASQGLTVRLILLFSLLFISRLGRLSRVITLRTSGLALRLELPHKLVRLPHLASLPPLGQQARGIRQWHREPQVWREPRDKGETSAWGALCLSSSCCLPRSPVLGESFNDRSLSVPASAGSALLPSSLPLRPSGGGGGPPTTPPLLPRLRTVRPTASL